MPEFSGEFSLKSCEDKERNSRISLSLLLHNTVELFTIRFLPFMKALAMFNSLAFLYADRSFPCTLADSGDKSLSINIDEKRRLFLSFLLFSKTQSQSILETNRTITGLGHGGRDSSTRISAWSSLLATPVETVEDAVDCVEHYVIWIRAEFVKDIHDFPSTFLDAFSSVLGNVVQAKIFSSAIVLHCDDSAFQSSNLLV